MLLNSNIAASAWKLLSLDSHQAEAELLKCSMIGKSFLPKLCKTIFSLLISFYPVTLLKHFHCTYYVLSLEYEFIYFYCLSSSLECKLPPREGFVQAVSPGPEIMSYP